MSDHLVGRIRAIRVPSTDRAVLVGLAFLGLALLGALIYPFASALLFAAVLAGALYPRFKSLASRLGGRPILAAGLVALSVGALIATPTLWLAARIGDEVISAVRMVEQTLRSGGGVPELVEMLPRSIQSRVRRVIDTLPGATAQIEGLADNGSGRAAGAVTSGIMATAGVVIDFSLMLVALFFFLLDGKSLVHWIARVAPLPERQILQILLDFRNVSVGVMMSSLGTAGVQSLAALMGYLASGVPQPMLFTLVTFIVAFIPAVGAASVVLAVAGLLLFTGHPQPALYLALWGILVVSTIDNIVKPWLLRDHMEINGGLIFFALLGGIATFGPVGLVAGPLILSFFLAVVRLWRKEPLPASMRPAQV